MKKDVKKDAESPIPDILKGRNCKLLLYYEFHISRAPEICLPLTCLLSYF